VITRRHFVKGLSGTALTGLLAGVYGGYVEPDLLMRVTNWALEPARWPRGRRLRIVMVADLHAGGPNMAEERVQQVVDLANAQNGDLIVLMGDYRATYLLQTHIVPIEATAEILAGLNAPLGVHAVLGNHDWADHLIAYGWTKSPLHSQTVLEKAGIAVLTNRAVKLGFGAASFWLAGLDSQTAFRAFGRRHDWKGASDLPGTLAQLTDEAPAILLAHEPDIILQVPDRIAVTLSGHTHGGQVRLGPWAPIVPSQFGNRFAYGWIREGQRDLVVSGGLGCSNMPVRFGVPPEITVVDLA
jgi:uncharacterized protein